MHIMQALGLHMVEGMVLAAGATSGPSAALQLRFLPFMLVARSKLRSSRGHVEITTLDCPTFMRRFED
jgi:hypothetical protein